MKNPITRDVFDTRDLIEYKEYLEQEIVDAWNDFCEEGKEVEDISGVDLENADFQNEIYLEEYEEVKEYYEELENTPDFIYGVTVIHESYWIEYVQEFIKDCGYLPKDIPWWLEDHIDWEGVASEVAQDYTEFSVGNDTYYYRS